MRYRIVKPSDAKQIARLHYNIRKFYNVGFFSKMSYSFLKTYYSIVLNDANYVAVCAQNEDGRIDGFASCSLDVKAQFQNIKKHWYCFALPALWSLIINPKILKDILDRVRAVGNNKQTSSYFSTSSVRGEYWGWCEDRPDPISSMEVHENLLKVLHSLNVSESNIEVDTINKNILNFHKINKAKEIAREELPDGRIRVYLRYDLNEKFSRKKK